MHSCHRIPQRHVNAGERHADQPLRSQQAQTPRQFLLDRRGSQHVVNHQRRQILDEIHGGFERCHRIGKDDSVSSHPLIGNYIDEDQRRFRHRAADSPMRVRHRDACSSSLKR